jgi:hypothetical protein
VGVILREYSWQVFERLFFQLEIEKLTQIGQQLKLWTHFHNAFVDIYF